MIVEFFTRCAAAEKGYNQPRTWKDLAFEAAGRNLYETLEPEDLASFYENGFTKVELTETMTDREIFEALDLHAFSDDWEEATPTAKEFELFIEWRNNS